VLQKFKYSESSQEKSKLFTKYFWTSHEYKISEFPGYAPSLVLHESGKNIFQKMVQAGPCRELIDFKRKKKVVVSFSYGYSWFSWV